MWEGVGEQEEEEEEGDFRSGAVHAAQSARPHKTTLAVLGRILIVLSPIFFLPKTIF